MTDWLNNLLPQYKCYFHSSTTKKGYSGVALLVKGVETQKPKNPFALAAEKKKKTR